MTADDRKYVWAAYKLGTFGPDISADTKVFTKQLNEFLALHNIEYIVESVTPKGRIPVGMIGGKFMGPILYLGDMTWFPWASDRNKMECMTNILNELRKHYIVMFYCSMDDKNFYINIAKHGVIRRVGTIYDLLVSGPSPLFQSRKA